MKKHLAILNKWAIKQIFSGQKNIETRFSQKRIAPFGKVNIGDIVYLKPPGEDIVGQFSVKKVISFAGLDSKDWQLIKDKFGQKISFGDPKTDEDYFNAHKNARYGSLIFIDRVEQFITSPLKISKKDLRGWVVL